MYIYEGRNQGKTINLFQNQFANLCLYILTHKLPIYHLIKEKNICLIKQKGSEEKYLDSDSLLAN